MKIIVKKGPMDWSKKSLKPFRHRCGVYIIYNIVRKKCYVGSSKDIAGRWEYHRKVLNRGIHENPKLQNAWNKYGEQAFQFHVLEDCVDGAQIILETGWIKRLNSCYNGYNCTPEAHNFAVWTPEMRQKKKEQLKKQREDPEFEKAWRNGMEELYADPEYQKANMDRMKVRCEDPVFKKTQSDAVKAMHADPEFKKEHSAKLRKYNQDPVVKKTKSDQLKKQHEDPVFREQNKIRSRERMTKNWQDPVFVAKVTARYNNKKGLV